MAVFTGAPDAGARAALDPETIGKGMAAWTAWMQRHQAQIAETGGPLGKTKRVNADGVADVRNNIAAYVVVEADSHEDAARMFENHPHFTIFPGDGVDVMPCLPIPQM
jgi:hypothetical protein